jgi:hypothetical protein
MPVNVHKILIHEPKITSTAILPTGQLFQGSTRVPKYGHNAFQMKLDDDDFKGIYHTRLVTFTSGLITPTNNKSMARTKISVQHGFSRSLSIDFPAQVEQEFLEKPSSNSSDDHSSGTEDDY